MKKLLLLSITFIFMFVFSACFKAPDAPVITRAPRPAGSSPSITLPTISGAVNTSSINQTPVTTSAPTGNIKVPLELSVKPVYNINKNSFACLFKSDYIYTFKESDKCTLTIQDGTSTETASGVIDLSLGNFMEEGLFRGVGFRTEYSFETGKQYSISVSIESDNRYIYTFSFSFTK